MTTLADVPMGKTATLAADYDNGYRVLPSGAQVVPLGYGYTADGVDFRMVTGPDGHTWGLPAALTVLAPEAAVGREAA